MTTTLLAQALLRQRRAGSRVRTRALKPRICGRRSRDAAKIAPAPPAMDTSHGATVRPRGGLRSRRGRAVLVGGPRGAPRRRPRHSQQSFAGRRTGRSAPTHKRHGARGSRRERRRGPAAGRRRKCRLGLLKHRRSSALVRGAGGVRSRGGARCGLCGLRRFDPVS